MIAKFYFAIRKIIPTIFKKAKFLYFPSIVLYNNYLMQHSIYGTQILKKLIIPVPERSYIKLIPSQKHKKSHSQFGNGFQLYYLFYSTFNTQLPQHFANFFKCGYTGRD